MFMIKIFTSGKKETAFIFNPGTVLLIAFSVKIATTMPPIPNGVLPQLQPGNKEQMG